MIKNNTIYTGRPYLKLEKNPYYSGSSKLNNIHLNLGALKLVSRVKTGVYNIELLKKIAVHQGVELKSYDIDPNNGDIEYMDFSQDKTPCFLLNDTWLSIEDLFCYYQRHMIVEGHGIARVYNDDDTEIIGYYGHTHRGGRIFKIGDILFDEGWVITPNHKDYAKYLNLSKYSDNIMDVVPFGVRGYVKIKNLIDAKQAAENMCEYLS